MAGIHNVLAGGGGARLPSTYTFTSNTADATLNITTLPGYVAGATDVTITVNSGVYLYATSTASAGLTLTGGSAGDSITLINLGFIMGKGGDGSVNTSTPGQTGGTAISLGFNTTINNTNAAAYIGGGGGGGGVCISRSFGGGGAGGGNGGGYSYIVSGTTHVGGTGGAVGASGTDGSVKTGCCFTYAGGGGGGRVFPGVGGSGGLGSFGGKGGTGGGGSGGVTLTFAGVPGGSGNNPGTSGGANVAGGGGGWGASAGATGSGTGTQPAGGGGKAVALNAHTVTWVSGDTTRVYGAVS